MTITQDTSGARISFGGSLPETWISESCISGIDRVSVRAMTWAFVSEFIG